MCVNNGIPWVSFCISTYKRANLLELQLQSLLKQTFQNFEIIISDNDPEGSGKEALRYINDTRVKYLINEVNLGMVKSFNKSLSNAKGQYVVMITDDDPVYPEMLQTLYDLTLKYPGYGMYQGGCETLCYSSKIAKIMRSKVGLNSCLSSELDYEEVKIFDAEDFPYYFFKGKLGALLLWSTAIIKRDILIANGGMPDYGTEYFTDHAFIVVNGSAQGIVYINKSLGYQAIHGQNFGFNELKNVTKYTSTPEAFSNWVEDRLKTRADWKVLKNDMHDFVGRAMVEFSLFIKKSLDVFNIKNEQFDEARKDVFKKSFLKKWRFKYFVLSKFPITFQYLISIKQKYF